MGLAHTIVGRSGSLSGFCGLSLHSLVILFFCILLVKVESQLTVKGNPLYVGGKAVCMKELNQRKVEESPLPCWRLGFRESGVLFLAFLRRESVV